MRRHDWASEERDTPTLENIEAAERQAGLEAWRALPFEERCRRVMFDFGCVDWTKVHTPRPEEQAAEGFSAFFPRTLPLNNVLFTWDSVADCWRELSPAVLYDALLATGPAAPMPDLVAAVVKRFERETRVERLRDYSAERWWRAVIKSETLPLNTPRKWKPFRPALLASWEVEELAANYGRPFGREALAVTGTDLFGLRTLLIRQSDGTPSQGWILPGRMNARQAASC